MSPAQRHRIKQQRRHEANERRLAAYQQAIRAYRQLATELRNQGLNEPGDHFAYRAQVCQRALLKQQGNHPKWLFWWILEILAGYGFKPQRTLLIYLLVLAISTGIYFWQGMTLLPHATAIDILGQSVVEAITALHGRGLFPGQLQSGWQLGMNAFDAVAGLIIEASFVATFVQRFFGK